MAEHRISSRYARAFVGLVVKNSVLEKAREDINLLASQLEANPDLLGMLKSPVINSGKKDVIIRQIFVSHVLPETMSFLKTLIIKKRENLLEDIIRSFNEQYHEIKNISKVKVTTAVPLDAESEKETIRQLAEKTGRTIILEKEVNDQIIGGLVIRFDHTLYDASIRHQLQNIHHQLIQRHISNN